MDGQADVCAVQPEWGLFQDPEMDFVVAGDYTLYSAALVSSRLSVSVCFAKGITRV